MVTTGGGTTNFMTPKAIELIWSIMFELWNKMSEIEEVQ